MSYIKEIKIIEIKLLSLSAELIALIPEDNEIIKIKKDYYKICPSIKLIMEIRELISQISYLQGKTGKRLNFKQ